MAQEHHRSNITIASNVYVRTNDALERDPQFVAQVTGGVALKELKEKLFGATNGAGLTKRQSDELLKSSNCSYNKRGDQAFGPIRVDGQVVWACRCEHKSCQNYTQCMAEPYALEIFRNPQTQPEAVAKSSDVDLLEFSYLGLTADAPQELEEALFAPPEIASEVLEADAVEGVDNPQPEAGTYLKISDPTPIIQAPIDQSIRVNAGPGTGKTYTVMQRLIYVLSHNLAEPENILVLCYTRAAVSVIRNRLEQAIAQGTLDCRSRQINICTLDSMASQFLAALDVNVYELDYNQRIEAFNDQISEDLFQSFEYVIIDEIQDLVNQRAKMALHILDAIECAFLLLGDSCQAIYDYSAHDDACMNAKTLYQEIDQRMPNGGACYELSRNMRQTQALSTLTDSMRQALLSNDVAQASGQIQQAIESIAKAQGTVETFVPTVQPGKKTAILCRNNGEAECISGLLWARGIGHTLLRHTSEPRTYQRWIGDVFWDYCAESINQSTFVRRYCARVANDPAQATKAFQALAALYREDADQVRRMPMDELRKALCQYKEGDAILWNEEDGALTVSTIHKAKGLEYDCVYLLESSFDVRAETTEEARVWYVGATRAKESLYRIGKKRNWYMRKTKDQRSYSVRQKGKTLYCHQLAIGQQGDAQGDGFLRLEMAHAVSRQAFIATEVQPNDKIEIILEKGKYTVKRCTAQGTLENLGSLSPKATEDIRQAVSIRPGSGLPERLYDIYVKNICTVVQQQANYDIPLRFRTSRIWLGIEMTGFAKIDWHYER